MLSILIPTYNYTIYPLVNELQLQCENAEINYEILVQDDASNSPINDDNLNIEKLDNCYFFSNKANLGRGRNINSLALKSKYDWLLIMDCDTFPTQQNFIKKYIQQISINQNSIFFGGILYEKQKPKKEQLLRWVYGNKREALSVEQRNTNSQFSALTSNLFIKKEIFTQHPFDSSIVKYGYEDLYFFSILNLNNYQITHIDNPTYHLGLETASVFLNKTKTALKNLVFLEESNKITVKESKIIATYNWVQKFRLTNTIALIFKKTQPKIEQNLFSEKPSLFWFDIYKLGYYCNLKNS